MIITRFSHTYDAPDNFIKMLTKTKPDGRRIRIYHGHVVREDYRSRSSFFGFFRNWRDEDRKRVINGMQLWAKRILIVDEIEVRLVRSGFKNVRVKV